MLDCGSTYNLVGEDRVGSIKDCVRHNSKGQLEVVQWRDAPTLNFKGISSIARTVDALVIPCNIGSQRVKLHTYVIKGNAPLLIGQ